MPPAIVLMQLSARPVPMIVESEALQMMKEGDKWRLTVTPELWLRSQWLGTDSGQYSTDI